jgi:putative transposase
MPSVPKQRHFYGLNHLHYLTTTTYRRARLFDSERFKRHFVTSWQDLRAELSFRIIGYVLMPEHFHILLWPSDLANPSQIMQKLEDRTAKFILKNLRHSREFAWCESMLNRLELPPTIHHHAHYRVWQRRFYDFNVWSDKKIKESWTICITIRSSAAWWRSQETGRGRAGGFTIWRTAPF